jgi:poly-gamma-glutamate capsule biosynthesis protein CapA/YwtB (metallophosphatase superfamily)
MVLFTGDWAPGSLKVNVEGNSSFIFANIEGPLSDIELVDDVDYPKVGPKLKSETISPGLIGLANLANNHIMDYGKNGLNQTIKKLK